MCARYFSKVNPAAESVPKVARRCVVPGGGVSLDGERWIAPRLVGALSTRAAGDEPRCSRRQRPRTTD